MHLLCPSQNPRDTGLGNTLFQLATMYGLSIYDKNKRIGLNLVLKKHYEIYFYYAYDKS